MIRLIEKKDYEKCLNIYNYFIANTTVTLELDQIDLPSFTKRIEGICEFYPWIVYEEDDKILGYAYLNVFNPRKAYVWTCDLSIYVDKDYHHTGVGSKLYEVIEGYAKKQGFHNIISIITASNEKSLGFHQKHGFKPYCTFERVAYKFNKWVNVSYFMKKINDSTDGEKILPFM